MSKEIPIIPSRHLTTGTVYAAGVKVAIEPSVQSTVIHKYSVPLHSFNMVLAKGTIIRDIAEQSGGMFMWAEQSKDTQNGSEGRCFEVFGTGYEMRPKNRKFLKTIHHSSGLVLHYYEVI